MPLTRTVPLESVKPSGVAALAVPETEPGPVVRLVSPLTFVTAGEPTKAIVDASEPRCSTGSVTGAGNVTAYVLPFSPRISSASLVASAGVKNSDELHCGDVPSITLPAVTVPVRVTPPSGSVPVAEPPSCDVQSTKTTWACAAGAPRATRSAASASVRRMPQLCTPGAAASTHHTGGQRRSGNLPTSASADATRSSPCARESPSRSPTPSARASRRSASHQLFGLIGSGNFVVTNALRRGGARFVAARHECGAVMMADGWARATGRVGVCCVHQGPGLTNAVTGLAEAAKSRTPLLVLSGDTPAGAVTSNFHIDQDALVQSVGAIAERIHSARTAERDAARALTLALTERRPVVLEHADRPAGAAGRRSVRRRHRGAPGRYRRSRSRASRGGRGAAGERPPAGDHRRPRRRRRGCRAGDRRLGEACGAVLATSAVAHGIFDGDPFAVGICGGFATPLAAELLGDADVVVAFGATLNGWTTRHGRLLHAQAKLIQVDVDPQAIGVHRRCDAAVIGDAASWRPRSPSSSRQSVRRATAAAAPGCASSSPPAGGATTPYTPRRRGRDRSSRRCRSRSRSCSPTTRPS